MPPWRIQSAIALPRIAARFLHFPGARVIWPVQQSLEETSHGERRSQSRERAQFGPQWKRQQRKRRRERIAEDAGLAGVRTVGDRFFPRHGRRFGERHGWRV